MKMSRAGKTRNVADGTRSLVTKMRKSVRTFVEHINRIVGAAYRGSESCLPGFHPDMRFGRRSPCHHFYNDMSVAELRMQWQTTERVIA